MSVQHLAIYHCQTCGRVVHQLQELSPPSCCQQEMACAVPSIIEEPAPTTAEFQDSAAHALRAEMDELLDWCRAQQGGGASHYQELAGKCEALHSALEDPFQDMDSPHAEAPGVVGSNELEDHRQELISSLQRFIDDLQQKEPSFRSWAEVCDRLESLLGQFRHRGETEHAAFHGEDDASNRLM